MVNTCGSKAPANAPASQVLFDNLPVALAAVDCDGSETSITECQTNDGLIGTCTNVTSSTVLACGNSVDGVMLYPMYSQAVCMVYHTLEQWSIIALCSKFWRIARDVLTA